MRFLPFAFLLAAPVAAVAQQKVDIRRPATPNVSVRLGGQIAALRIVAWAHDSIALVGAVGAGTRLDGGPLNREGPVQGMKFFVEAASDATITGNKLELRVPRGARVWAKAGSADIEASGVEGGLDLNIIGGSIRVTGRSRELIVESMDGSVHVAGSTDYARVKTATGDITFTASGDDVSLSTVSGGIQVGEAERSGTLTRVRVESVTGPLTFAGSLARGADARFDTHSGSIDLRLDRSSVSVDAVTMTGRIENGLSKARPIAGREGRGMEVGISSGTSAASVTVRSFKGNVRLSPR